MFGIGTPELLVILAVALIVIGPKKLPDLAKSLGRALGDFKRATNDLKQSIEQETGLDEVRKDFAGVKQDVLTSVDPTPSGEVKASPADAASDASQAPLESETDEGDSSPSNDDHSEAGHDDVPDTPPNLISNPNTEDDDQGKTTA